MMEKVTSREVGDVVEEVVVADQAFLIEIIIMKTTIQKIPNMIIENLVKDVAEAVDVDLALVTEEVMIMRILKEMRIADMKIVVDEVDIIEEIAMKMKMQKKEVKIADLEIVEDVEDLIVSLVKILTVQIEIIIMTITAKRIRKKRNAKFTYQKNQQMQNFCSIQPFLQESTLTILIRLMSK